LLVQSCLAAALLAFGSAVSLAQQNGGQNDAGQDSFRAPRWAMEIKGGQFKPDLDLYKDFYGSDKTTYWALNGAFRFNNWLELGAELGYSNDKGVGLLPNNGQLGGQVRYTLVPAQVFVNFRYDASPRQLFVPYAGIGLVTAWYRQKIDQQDDREGRTDLGGAARAGVQLLLNRLDRRGADTVRGDRRLRTWLFAEAQVFSAEIDNIDLGGELFLVGLRFEFDGS